MSFSIEQNSFFELAKLNPSQFLYSSFHEGQKLANRIMTIACDANPNFRMGKILASYLPLSCSFPKATFDYEEKFPIQQAINYIKHEMKQATLMDVELKAWIADACDDSVKSARQKFSGRIKKYFATKDDGLNFSYFPLAKLPSSIGRLSHLTLLDLSHVEVDEVPPEIGQLSNLKALYLRENKLTSISPEIGRLFNLKELYLYDNQLTSIPSKIGQLSNLIYLTLDRNQLVSIPPEIGRLSNLENLELNNNHIASISLEIGQLQHLQSLLIYCNPNLSELPMSLGIS